jgi:hypothetical protein
MYEIIAVWHLHNIFYLFLDNTLCQIIRYDVDECYAEESSACLSCCALNIMGQEHFRYQIDQEGKGLESSDKYVPILV